MLYIEGICNIFSCCSRKGYKEFAGVDRGWTDEEMEHGILLFRAVEVFCMKLYDGEWMM